MIIDPDFLDHWKVIMLADLLNDELAPTYVIRLWAHCQNRKEWVFHGLPTTGLRAIARFKGNAKDFEAAMIDCGFIVRENNNLIVCGWEKHNASLVASWVNGKKGGRPKKAADKTHGLAGSKPSGSESVETGLAHEKPIREEKRRKEKSTKKETTRFTPPTVEEVAAYCRERGNSVDAQRWHDHYSAKGWLIGKAKMKSWQAAVRTWERSSDSSTPQNYQQGAI